eukprot:754954-Rhodomonas_salina.1
MCPQGTSAYLTATPASGSILRLLSYVVSGAANATYYAKSGTAIAYRAASCYAMSGTAIAYHNATCYAMSGTDRGYAATRRVNLLGILKLERPNADARYPSTY